MRMTARLALNKIVKQVKCALASRPMFFVIRLSEPSLPPHWLKLKGLPWGRIAGTEE